MRASFFTPVCVGCALLFAPAAVAGPEKHWTGSEDGSSVSLYIEGPRVRGDIMVLVATNSDNMPRRNVEMKLTGSGFNGRYKGTLSGTVRIDGPPQRLTGKWSAVVGDNAHITFVCGSDGIAETRRNVQLLPGSEGTFPQRIAWSSGSLLCKSETAHQYARITSINPVNPGATLETGPKSSAILIFADRSAVIMRERTRVIIPNTAENRRRIRKVEVVSGTIWAAVRKGKDTELAVESEHTLASTRGGEFSFEAARSGAVTVTTAAGETIITHRRSTPPQTVTKAGRTLRLSPVAMPKSPSPTKIDLKPVALQWRALLTQLDTLWQHRRSGVTAIWQDRYFKSKAPSVWPRSWRSASGEIVSGHRVAESWSMAVSATRLQQTSASLGVTDLVREVLSRDGSYPRIGADRVSGQKRRAGDETRTRDQLLGRQ